MLRLLIVLPIYAAVIVFLPQWSGFRDIGDALARTPPDLAFGIVIAGAVIGGAGAYVVRERPQRFMLRQPRLWSALSSGFMGLLISGVIDIFQKLSGGSITLVWMLVVPLAFFLSEAIYLAIDWRLNRDKTPAQVLPADNDR